MIEHILWSVVLYTVITAIVVMMAISRKKQGQQYRMDLNRRDLYRPDIEGEKDEH